MRPSAEEIKAAILHPDRDVREAAVFYFSKSHSDDPSIMPLVIQSVQRYGMSAFGTYSFLIGLPHTTESVAWLIRQIENIANGPSEAEQRTASAMRLALLRCPPGLLQQHQDAIQSMQMLDESTKREFADRIAVGSMTGDVLWAALHDFCEQMDDEESFASTKYDHARYLANALAPYGNQYGDKICGYLRDPDDSIGWLEVFAVIAAGAMKLEAAVPSLVDTLADLDTYACQEAHSALERIGGDSVVQELVRHYAPDGEINLAVVAILENIQTDSSIEACYSLLADEKDKFLRGFLLKALLSNFESAAIEPARQHVLNAEKSPDTLEVRAALLAACKLLNQSFPEFEAWLEDSKYDTEFRKQWYQDHPLSQFADDDDDFDDDFDEVGLDDLLDDFDDGDATEIEASPPSTIRRGARVGRNDPCPCGSGKKYKKCCQGKASTIEETDAYHASALGTVRMTDTARKYPIGTIAHYGPNENTTTKIAASVIKYEHAEPIVERWVGTNVVRNPKVQRQIRALFDKYRVKVVVQTEGNIGCPHEEGLDFPVGEDCPFCPFWEGKQGRTKRS